MARSRNISDLQKPVYVWIWLPGRTDPVVCGVVRTSTTRSGGQVHSFRYAPSYLERRDAIPIYGPELPLRGEAFVPHGVPEPGAPTMAGCLRDAMPDAWGRRVIVNRLTGERKDAIDVDRFPETVYMLNSGSDRIGALDFQASPTDYVARAPRGADLEELIEAAAYVESGRPIPPRLDNALFHGNSIGGARPKAMIDSGGKKLLLKFPSVNDVFPVLRGEFVAMRLAALAGLNVAYVEMIKIGMREALAIERFDRIAGETGWQRRLMVSALTALELDEMTARYASYEDLADRVRHGRNQPKETLKELFGRISFNILCGNTDDHARNHALFWNGQSVELTPAYDICPQARTGRIASQAMMIAGDDRSSTLATCVRAAERFMLTRSEAREIIESQIEVIKLRYAEVCDEAGLGEVDRKAMWGNQFLNEYAFEGFTRAEPVMTNG